MTVRLHRFAALLSLLASLSLVLVGCGDDDEGAAAGDEAAPAEDEVAGATEEGGEAETGASTEGATEADGEGDRADWPDTLVFGAVPAEESTSLEQSYETILTVLEDELGLDIEFTQATDYAGIIEAQIAGNVDLAQYGPFSYAIAVANGAEIEPVGALIDEEGAEPGYVSYGITAGDNEAVDSIEDFAGKTVCFVDPASTSGFLYPSAGLIEAGIDPETDITPTFAGGHDASVISVANGDCEVGFAFDAMVDTQLIEDGTIAEGDVKTVWKSEIIAGSPLAVRTTLPESLVAEIERVILELANEDFLLENGFCGEDAAECKVTDEGAWGYAEVDDAFYDGVRAVCEATKAESCEGIA